MQVIMELGRHRSLDKELKRSIKWLLTNKYVDKVVLGFSECCRHKYAPGFIKYRIDVPAGIKANGYSGKGVTDLFVKISPIEKREHVKEYILTKFI